MPLKDPANLIQRIPELEALAADPKIHKAIETGDPFKVYRALAWAKWLRRLPQYQAALDMLVRHRRLFAKPLNGTPALATLNSVGFSFVGRAEKEEDGSFIAMHAFVVLYLIPIIPLRSYLVKKADSSLFSSRWNIFARVPSSMLGWMYSRSLAFALVVLVGWGAIGSVIKSRTQEITVVNGFDVPVDVVLDGTRRTVAPLGHDTITVKTGAVRGSAVAKGVTVDTLQHDVASSAGVTLWNIAGAAPVFQERVTYSKNPSAQAGGNGEPTVYCGQQFVQVGHVDDVFSTPPQSMRMNKYDEHVYRTHLDVARSDQAPGYLGCFYYLTEHDHAGAAAHALEAAAELKGWEADATSMALYSAAQASNADAVRIAKRALQARPDDVLLHRRYQAVRDYVGQADQLEQEYAELARRQPDSASAQYLYANLKHGHAGIAALEQLTTRYGKDPNILRSLTWRRMTHGDYAGTIDGWNRLHAMAPADAAIVLDAQVRALVATRRASDAARLLAEQLADPHDDSRAEHAAEYLMVVNLTGRDPRAQLDRLGKGSATDAAFDAVRVRAGLDPLASPAEQSHVVHVMLALRGDPASALRLAKGLSQAEFAQLGSEQWGLLFGEAARRNDQGLVAKLERVNMATSRAERALLKRFVQGDEVNLDDADLEPGLRAAAMLARSRNTALTDAERAQWRTRAAQTDLLHSVVTSALAHWSA